MNKPILAIFIVAVIAMTVACQGPANAPTTGQPTNAVPTSGTLALSVQENQTATQGLIKFKSFDEARAFIDENQQSQQNLAVYKGGGIRATVGAEMATAPSAAPTAGVTTSTGAPGAVDYSQTNVQVQGVDEADFIKNDNRYIYTIANNNLVIVDALDAKNMKTLSTTQLGSVENYDSLTMRELLLDGDTLTVIAEGYYRSFILNPYDIRPYPEYRPTTFVFLYDVSDRSSPKKVKEFTITGNYFQSRLIGDIVYLVSQEGTGGTIIYEPRVTAGVSVISPDIYYFDNPENAWNFNTVTSIDVKQANVVQSKTFMLGYTNTLYVSQDNIYIAYQKQQYWCRFCFRPYYNQEPDKQRFYDVVVPRLVGDIKSQVQAVIDKHLNEKDEWQQISGVLIPFFTKIESDAAMQQQYSAMLTDIQDGLAQYDAVKAIENSATIIQRIAIDRGAIDWKAKGEVSGSLLNQWSLDEFNGNLRVATTVNVWTQKQIEFNNVYVLDSSMGMVGKLEHLAQDERIYSTRFLGNRLYMVTFKQTDPFFVIDLSQPAAPKVMGKLKLPGFSQYLHPYDDTHIIGVGKDTTTDDSGMVRTGGIKVALFDVSDVANPRLVDSETIGNQGSDSPVLYDHKAFLFSKSKGIMVVPVTRVTIDSTWYQDKRTVWDGAYVFGVTANGFTRKGTVQHGAERSDYWGWQSPASVMRSLYMDNNLYTVSTQYIKANDLANSLAPLGMITLPGEAPQQVKPMPTPIPLMG
jgi:uncharacterized secreted protein with C-terminal beta-propeller domain